MPHSLPCPRSDLPNQGNQPSLAAADSNLYPPVEVEEIAFALTVFVSASNQTLAYRSPLFQPSGESVYDCEQLFTALHGNDSYRQTASLSTWFAFLALWHHYETSAVRNSICARVLGFFLLLERTGGAQLARWIERRPEQPRAVELHPELTMAIATVVLEDDGGLSEVCFYATIEELRGSGEA